MLLKILKTIKVLNIWLIVGLSTLSALHGKSLKEVLLNQPTKYESQQVIKTAKKYLGTRYKFGGTSRKGIDCSGFVQKVYKSQHIKLPRTARQQYRKGKKIPKYKAQKGDLIFFADSTRSIGHVGIVIDPKRHLMIHASSGAKKVTISNYNKPYYKKKFKGVKRLARKKARV